VRASVTRGYTLIKLKDALPVIALGVGFLAVAGFVGGSRSLDRILRGYLLLGVLYVIAYGAMAIERDVRPSQSTFRHLSTGILWVVVLVVAGVAGARACTALGF
jgi:hypothetical protein